MNKPRYQQLKDHIIDKISSGDLKPADRVPSENELVESAGVSRMTANRALKELNSEGYVERIAGRGTFVSDYRSRSHLLEVHNIADEIKMRGGVHSSEVLTLETLPADQKASEALRVAIGASVNHVSVVHLENDVPIQLELRYVRAAFAPEFLKQDFVATTPSAYLTGIAPLQEAEQVVRAAIPNANVRRLLAMAAEEATLVVSRRTWSRGRPVTYARLYHPGDRYELGGQYRPPGAIAANATGQNFMEIETS